MAGKIKPAGKFALIFIIMAAIGGGLWWGGLLDNVAPGGPDKIAADNSASNSNIPSESTPEGVTTYRVGVVDWGGYVGGYLFNKGFAPTTNSRFYKDYGFLVEFITMNDFDASRAAWKADNIDLMWATTGSFSTEAVGMKELSPKILFQTDWSRGGDAIVVRKGINTVSDLKGKTIAVAPMTPSHTFLINLLEVSGLKESDVTLVTKANAIDAAGDFMNKQVDAAIVWSPDDRACVETVSGSKILQSTKEASNIIADVFFAKESFINAHKSDLIKLYEGWMIGDAEINSSEESKSEAAQILADNSAAFDKAGAIAAINNVRLTTNGDNLNYFGINKNYKGVTGEKLYSTMTSKYKKAGYISPSENTYWRDVAYSNIVSSASLSGDKQNAEGIKSFTAPVEAMYDQAKTQAVAAKKVSITFATGAFALDGNSEYIIDKEMAEIAKQFGNSRIRIAGNTDNTGSAATNEKLSKKRAQSVANYLVNTFGFDKNRFVVIGNGPKQAISDGVSGSNENYRRTDFELIN